jgi:hypothetical protein
LKVKTSKRNRASRKIFHCEEVEDRLRLCLIVWPGRLFCSAARQCKERRNLITLLFTRCTLTLFGLTPGTLFGITLLGLTPCSLTLLPLTPIRL